MTKRMLLVGLKAFEKQFGLKWLYLIPSTLYGPGFESHDNHFIFDLVRKIYNGKHRGEEVELWGDGTQRRELIYVEDAVDAMLSLLEQENEMFNLGSAKDFAIKDYAQKICDFVGYDHSKIFYNVNRHTGVKKRSLKVDKIQKFALNYCKTPLEEGIEKIVNYYHDTYGVK